MKLTDTYSRLAVYHSQNYYLSQYMGEKTIDLVRYLDEFIQWPSPSRDEICERAGVDLLDLIHDHENGNDDIYESSRQIEDEMTADEKKSFAEYLIQVSAPDAPSWALMSIQNSLLPRQTWLVHFSGQAEGIIEEGFIYGVDDMTRLALTHHLEEESKLYGGYNFAFVAGNMNSQIAAATGKYGESAVMFQSSGIEVYHHGDVEHQVIFWGGAIDPRTMVTLSSDGDEWMVVPRTSSSMNQRGRNYVFKGDFHSVVNWVKSHWFQYRRQILGN